MFYDKKILKKSLRYYSLFFFIGILFFSFGILSIFFVYKKFTRFFDIIFGYAFGMIFSFLGFFLLCLFFRGVLRYYRKHYTKEYGDYISAVISKISIEYLEEEQQSICVFEYSYNYDGKQYTSKEVCDQENIFREFQVGSSISIYVQTLHPEISSFREKKFLNNMKRLGKS